MCVWGRGLGGGVKGGWCTMGGKWAMNGWSGGMYVVYVVWEGGTGGWQRGAVRCGGCPFARWWAGEALLDVYIRTHIDT